MKVNVIRYRCFSVCNFIITSCTSCITGSKCTAVFLHATEYLYLNEVRVENVDITYFVKFHNHNFYTVTYNHGIGHISVVSKMVCVTVHMYMHSHGILPCMQEYKGLYISP